MADVISLKPRDDGGPFVVGSTVILNGGGTIMTVRNPGRQLVTVEWHNESNDPIREEYIPAMLMHANPDDEKDESAK